MKGGRSKLLKSSSLYVRISFIASHTGAPRRLKVGVQGYLSMGKNIGRGTTGRSPFEEPTLIAWMLLLPLQPHEPDQDMG